MRLRPQGPEAGVWSPACGVANGEMPGRTSAFRRSMVISKELSKAGREEAGRCDPGPPRTQNCYAVTLYWYGMPMT